jgi:Protein of unknown function (DUF1761)
MPFKFAEINWLAVVVAALVAFLVGGVWYQALFGKLWLKLHGYTAEQELAMKALRPPPLFFGGMIVSYLVLALVLALLISAMPEKTALGGAALGVLVWLGPAAAIGMTGWLASNKELGIYLIDIGCELVYLVLMGLILGGWRS